MSFGTRTPLTNLADVPSGRKDMVRAHVLRAILATRSRA